MKRSHDGKKLLVNLEINKIRFTVVNVYALNDIQSRNYFLKAQSFVNKHRERKNVLLCGDFNCHLNNEQDISSRF